VASATGGPAAVAGARDLAATGNGRVRS